MLEIKWMSEKAKAFGEKVPKEERVEQVRMGDEPIKSYNDTILY